MNLKSFAIILASGFVLAGPSLAVEKTCDYCHEGHSGTGALLKKDINELCLGCHQDRAGRGEHKVGISPSGPVSGLPLNDGKISCATCHNPHSKTKFMLRKPVNEICLSCHNY